MVYTANWGIICHLPPFTGTRNNHWKTWRAFFFSLGIPPQKITCPQKRGNFKKEISSSNYQFSGYFSFKGDTLHWKNTPLAQNDHTNMPKMMQQKSMTNLTHTKTNVNQVNQHISPQWIPEIPRWCFAIQRSGTGTRWPNLVLNGVHAMCLNLCWLRCLGETNKFTK